MQRLGTRLEPALGFFERSGRRRMGGWYIFDKAGGSKSFGLVAVGSTKTGSMLYFENFYGPMGSGKVGGLDCPWSGWSYFRYTITDDTDESQRTE